MTSKDWNIFDKGKQLIENPTKERGECVRSCMYNYRYRLTIVIDIAILVLFLLE